MRALILILAVLPLLATQAHAEEVRPYSAQETVRRAQIGTNSPRLAPPVRVAPAPARTARPSRYDRMVCRVDPAKPLRQQIICEKQK